jgi:uncharacterized protein YjbI with pentapeptide repeats
MATKKQLRDRWKVEPGLTIDRKIVEFCSEQYLASWASPDPERLFGLLDGLPYREEVPSGRDLRGSSFPGAVNMDLHEADMSYCGKLTGIGNCRLHGARLDEVTGEIGDLTGEATGASFRKARLRGTWLMNSRFEDCDFTEVTGRSAVFRGSSLRGSTFANADWRGADFQECDLRGCTFRGADLSGAMFRAVELDETTDLRGARLVDVTFDALVDKQGNTVLEGTEWRHATYDETTITGHQPGAVDREVLDLVIHEADAQGTGWSNALAETAADYRLRLESDPEFRWYEALLESVDPAHRREAEALIERASMRL